MFFNVLWISTAQRWQPSNAGNSTDWSWTLGSPTRTEMCFHSYQKSVLKFIVYRDLYLTSSGALPKRLKRFRDSLKTMPENLQSFFRSKTWRSAAWIFHLFSCKLNWVLQFLQVNASVAENGQVWNCFLQTTILYEKTLKQKNLNRNKSF